MSRTTKDSRRLMFKTRLLQFLRKFCKAEQPQPAPPEPVQDLQTRLQHLSERYPSVEPGPDAVHMHEVPLCEVDFATEQELALGSEAKGLNNWASKRRKTTNSGDNIVVPKSPFEYAIDPGRAPSKPPEHSQQSMHHKNATPSGEVQGRNLDEEHHAARTRDGSDTHQLQNETEPYQTNQLRRDLELLRDDSPPPIRQPQPVSEMRYPVISQPISDAALREITRLELINRRQISRSLSGFRDENEIDTALADRWDCCSYNSLFVLPDQSGGATTEYEEDYEEDLLPYFTETLLLQEEDVPDVFELPPRPGQTVQPTAEGKQTNSQTSANSAARKKQTDGASKRTKTEKPVSSKAGTPDTTPANQPGTSQTANAATGVTESSTALQPYKNFSENALKLIAQKPETPAATLKWLASHTNPHIRAAVAKNPSTPADTITVLAKDHEAGIRHSIAENPLSSMDALNLLIKDRNPLIAWRAQNTVFQIKENLRSAQRAKESAMQELQKEKESVHQVKEAKIATTEETIAFLQVIARKTNTPARRLDELARHADARVRGAVAENANAPAEILWLLSKDPESLVKTKVTDNYNCPIEILEAMKEDEDAYVAYQAHSVLNRVLGASFTDNHIRTATWP